MTFKEIVETPENGVWACKFVGVFNTITALSNLYLGKWGQFGIGIASVLVCWGGVYLFKEGIKMREQNKEMRDIRVGLEADIWDMEHGKPTEQ